MRRRHHKIDTSRELLLQRWAGGFMLVRPDGKITSKSDNTYLFPSVMTLGQMLDQSFDVYLYNCSHQFQVVNDEFVKSGFISIKNLCGKHAEEVFPREGAALVKNNMEVLTARSSRIVQEDVLLSSGVTQEYLSIKSPLYNENSKLIGIFGISILLGEHNIAESLLHVTKLGMLNPARFPVSASRKSEMTNTAYTFSKRERECLFYLSRAKTSKEIAAILNISIRTIEHYIDNIKTKIGIASRSELIAFAINLFS